MGYNPNYQTERRIYARYILKNHPDAKIGIPHQNDDLGRDYVIGLQAGLGDKVDKIIVAEAASRNISRSWTSNIRRTTGCRRSAPTDTRPPNS
jgi:hypothetical protein